MHKLLQYTLVFKPVDMISFTLFDLNRAWHFAYLFLKSTPL